MDKDEKIIEAINYMKEQIKMLAEFCSKGALFHLAITAFSITLAFQNKIVPLDYIQLSNIMISVFGLFISKVIYNDGEKMNNQIITLFKDTGLILEKLDLKGWFWIAVTYSASCLILILFWTALWFIKIKV